MTRSFITLSIILLAWILPTKAALTAVKTIPAADTEVSSLSTITVFWDAEWLEDLNYGICGRVEDSSGTQVATLKGDDNYSYKEAASDLILSEKISAPGVYTVYVNADVAFNEDEIGNEAFTIRYTIASGTQKNLKLVSADPANNTTVSSLSKIETVWSEKISTVNTEIKCEVLDSFNDKVSDVTVSKGVFSTDPVTFTLKKSIETDGTYKLVIPVGVLETSDGIKSEAVTLTYTVNPSTADALTPIEIDPADNSVLPYLSEFTITWDADFDFDFYAKEVGKVVDELGINVAIINCYADIMEENMIFFELSQPISNKGEYTVVIDAGRIIAANGAKNDEITLKFTIDPSQIEADLEYTVSPDESEKIVSESFPNVKLLFDEEVKMNISEFTFESDSDDWVKVGATLDYDEVVLDCSGIKKAGTWTLIIPEGAFKSVETGSINPEKTYQWEFNPSSTGIEEIGNNNERITFTNGHLTTLGYDKVRIYDMSGILFLEAESDVDVTLPAGIYILQCKKQNHTSNYKLYLDGRN